MNWLIYVLIVVFVILILAITWRLIDVYISEDYKQGNYFGKIMFTISVLVATMCVVLFPLDVYNGSGLAACDVLDVGCGNINFSLIWNIMFWVIIIFSVFIIPFTMFYYEADGIDNPPVSKKLLSAFISAFITTVVVAVLCVVFYFITHTTNLPITSIDVPTPYSYDLPIDELINVATNTTSDIDYLTNTEISNANLYTSVNTELRVEVPITASVVGLFCIVGWLLFALFAGAGLTALPSSLLRSWIYRPRYMPPEKFNEEKSKLAGRLDELIESGEALQKHIKDSSGLTFKWMEKRKVNKELKKEIADYRESCKQLDDDYQTLRAEHLEYKNNNPLIPVFNLMGGIVAIIITVLWLLQLALYVFPIQFSGSPLSLFLNTFLIWCNDIMTILGIVLLLILVLYLMLCSMKGAFSLGLKFIGMDIHSMNVHDTMINSLVFNGGLFLLVTLPLLEFSQNTFSDFAANSDIKLFFGVMIEKLDYVRYLFEYNVFIYLLLVSLVISGLYFMFKPNDRKKRLRSLKKDIAFTDKREYDRDMKKRESKRKRQEEQEEKDNKKNQTEIEMVPI